MKLCVWVIFIRESFEHHVLVDEILVDPQVHELFLQELLSLLGRELRVLGLQVCSHLLRQILVVRLHSLSEVVLVVLPERRSTSGSLSLPTVSDLSAVHVCSRHLLLA